MQQKLDWLPEPTSARARMAKICADAVRHNVNAQLGEEDRNTGACVFLFLLFGAISTIALPFAWHKQVNARRHVAKLLSTMISLYNDLKSDGPISAPYIRDHSLFTERASQTDYKIRHPAISLRHMSCRNGGS